MPAGMKLATRPHKMPTHRVGAWVDAVIAAKELDPLRALADDKKRQRSIRPLRRRITEAYARKVGSQLDFPAIARLHDGIDKLLRSA